MAGVETLLATRELRSIEHAVQVGRAVMAHVDSADGDTRPASLRTLAGRSGVQLSTTSLWRATQVFRLSMYWPSLVRAEHLRLSHVYAVLKLPRARQTTLLAQGE